MRAVLTSRHVNPVERKDLRALRDKYERILALRKAHDDPKSEPDPRPELARLAEQFPGALREIDRLPIDMVEARIQALVEAERTSSKDSVETWMIAQVLFHRYARGAIATKRWLAGRKAITPALRTSFVRAVRSLTYGAEAELFVDSLHVIAAPPRGRVMDVVYELVAADLAVTPTEARALVLDTESARRAAARRVVRGGRAR